MKQFHNVANYRLDMGGDKTTPIYLAASNAGVFVASGVKHTDIQTHETLSPSEAMMD